MKRQLRSEFLDNAKYLPYNSRKFSLLCWWPWIRTLCWFVLIGGMVTTFCVTVSSTSLTLKEYNSSRWQPPDIPNNTTIIKYCDLISFFALQSHFYQKIFCIRCLGHKTVKFSTAQSLRFHWFVAHSLFFFCISERPEGSVCKHWKYNFENSFFICFFL